MAVNLDVVNLDEFPENAKRITLDIDNVVLTDNYGDEELLLTVGTTAYSDNVNRTTIPSIYITKGRVGWNESNANIGGNGKYLLTSANYRLAVKLDATVSGTTGNGYYDIDLEYNVNGTPVTGAAVAEDMQKKIRDIECTGVDVGFQDSYKNAYVTYVGASIRIASGALSNDYDGDDRSSVAIGTVDTNDCADALGFNIGNSSENFASSAIESMLLVTYAPGTTPLTVGLNSGIVAGDAIAITDKTGIIDYFTAISISGNEITVAVSATNGFDAISHQHTIENFAYVQVLKKGYPNQTVPSYFEDVDSLLRFGTTQIMNKIDFSS